MSRSKHSKKNQPFITKYDRISQERLLNKSIVYGALGIFAAVILLILYGIIYINKIQPTQPIATVGGEVITTRAFQARVRFERQQLINIWLQNQQYMQMFGQSNDSFAEQFQNQMIQVESRLNSDTFGESILNQMIDEIVIRQKAQELGITVSAQEVEKSIAEDFFGFYANGTSTPEVSPTIRSTSTLSITQLSLVTLTPTATATMAGTSAAPTHAPTKTPSLTPEATLEHTQDPASNSDAAAAPSETPATPTATLGIPTAVPTVYTTQIYGENRLSGIEYYEQETGFSEADMWAMVESRLYRDKVMKFLEGESPVEEEQAWVRHIVVETEEQALEVISRLASGEDWTDLAKELSKDQYSSDDGGDLGWFANSSEDTTVTAEFLEFSFSAGIGEISAPIESPAGWHVAQVLGHEIRPLEQYQINIDQNKVFTDWLIDARTSTETIIESYWPNRVPDEPRIPQLNTNPGFSPGS